MLDTLFSCQLLERKSSTDEEETLSLSPEEEARIIQIRIDKKKLAIAAQHFNTDGQKSFKTLSVTFFAAFPCFSAPTHHVFLR